MAASSGTAGSVLVGTVVVGEISEWSLDISMNPITTTTFGDVWEEVVPSIRSATGAFSGNMDGTDTAQGTLRNSALGGSVCALKLYDSATKFWTIGSAYITGTGKKTSVEGKNETSYQFKASGAVSYT